VKHAEAVPRQLLGAAAEESTDLARKVVLFCPKRSERGSKARVLFIDQLTGVLYKLFIPEYLPACMGRRNRPK
jgi:hypothetical protein